MAQTLIIRLHSFIDPRLTPAKLDMVHSSGLARTGSKSKRKVVTITRTITTTKQKPTSVAAAPATTPDASCKGAITPACLQALYTVPAKPAQNRTSNLFVATFIGESADPKDLTVRDWLFLYDVSQLMRPPSNSWDNSVRTSITALHLQSRAWTEARITW